MDPLTRGMDVGRMEEWVLSRVQTAFLPPSNESQAAEVAWTGRRSGRGLPRMPVREAL